MGPRHKSFSFVLFYPTTTKPFTVVCSAEPTLAHLLSHEGPNMIFMGPSQYQQHEIPTCYDHLNLAILYSKCQLTPAMLLRGFLVRFGGEPMRETVRVVLEYPRVTCDSHYSWFNETVDGLVCRLHSSSIKKNPAHCRPAYNSRLHRKY